MSRNVLISYRFRDVARARQVEAFFVGQGTECEGEAVFSDTDPTEGAESAIKHEVNPLVNDCEAVLLVLGATEEDDDTWLDREVRLARKLGVAVAAVQLRGTAGGVPDRIRGGGEIPLVEWGPGTICQALSEARRLR